MAPLNQKLTLNTSEFYLNGNGKIADVTFRTGSTLTGSSYFKLGNNAAATSTLVLDGGSIDLTTQSTLGWVWMGVNANQVDFTVNAGTLTTWGILCRTGWKDPATFGEQFTMNGGTLNITGDAIRGWTHFNHFCEFNGGTVNSLANWHVEQMRSSGFGSRPGGLVTLQLNDKTVNWATGLAGAADVQLKGNGTLKSGTGEKSTKLFMQGALTGKWTVENSGENDLSGASAFLGGLELAENVNAKLHIAGSNLVEAVYLQTSATTVTKTDALKKGYPFLCNDLKTMHAYENSATYDKVQFMWQGMFYADEAGTWAFAGSYDDYLGLEIDGEAVVRLRLQRCGPPARRLPHRRPFTAPPATKDSNQNFFLFARMAEYAGKADCPSQFRLRSCRLGQGEVLVRASARSRFCNRLGFLEKTDSLGSRACCGTKSVFLGFRAQMALTFARRI